MCHNSRWISSLGISGKGGCIKGLCVHELLILRDQKRHIKLLHIKLCPVTLVTGLFGRVPGQKDLCSLV